MSMHIYKKWTVLLTAIAMFGLATPVLADDDDDDDDRRPRQSQVRRAVTVGDDDDDDDDDDGRRRRRSVRRNQGAQISRQRAAQIAAARVGGRVEDIDFENSSRYGAHYEVKVENRNGQDYKVRVSARNGRVLSVRRDG